MTDSTVTGGRELGARTVSVCDASEGMQRVFTPLFVQLRSSGHPRSGKCVSRAALWVRVVAFDLSSVEPLSAQRGGA